MPGALNPTSESVAPSPSRPIHCAGGHFEPARRLADEVCLFYNHPERGGSDRTGYCRPRIACSYAVEQLVDLKKRLKSRRPGEDQIPPARQAMFLRYQWPGGHA